MAVLTAIITASNKTYDATTAATVTEITFAENVGGDDVTIIRGTGSTATFANANVGTGKTVTVTNLELSGADAGNHSLSSTTGTGTANITARAITVTANDISKASGASDPTLTDAVTSGALQGADTLSGSLSRAAGETAGTSYAISQGTRTAGSNYTLTFVAGVFSISAMVSGIASNAFALNPRLRAGLKASLTNQTMLEAVALLDLAARTRRARGGTIAAAVDQALRHDAVSRARLSMTVS